MTILEIKTAIANYLEVTVADLTVNGQDLALAALNQVRLSAELSHDFNFQRKLLTLTVDPVTGGSLDTAVLYGTATTADIKLIVDIGQLDTALNFIPQEWTTVEEGLERQRSENPYETVRYPTDAQVATALCVQRRFLISNNIVFYAPKAATNVALDIAIEAYVFSADWTVNSNTVTVTGGTGITAVNTTYVHQGIYNGKRLYSNLGLAGTPAAIYYIWHSGTAWIINQLPGTTGTSYHSLTTTSDSPAGVYTGHSTYTGTPTAVVTDTDTTSDIWTTKGAQYLQWQALVELNHRFKYFVSRTEGNLPPPTALAQAGLQAFVDWDVYKYEQRRRHGR